MKYFKFLSNTPTNPYDIMYLDIPVDHYVINVSPIMYEPITLNTRRIVYHKHGDPNISRVYKMYIGEGHPLWNWPEIPNQL